jgi:hypothetical protein
MCQKSYGDLYADLQLAAGDITTVLDTGGGGGGGKGKSVDIMTNSGISYIFWAAMAYGV